MRAEPKMLVCALPPCLEVRRSNLSGCRPGKLRQIDAAIVPMEGIDADHALGPVEQRTEAAAAGLVGEFLHAVAHRHGGVAHDVDALLDLEDLIARRIGG